MKAFARIANLLANSGTGRSRRVALTTRDVSHRGDGSGAPSHALTLGGLLLALVFALALLAAPARAAYIETGSWDVTHPSGLGVNLSQGIGVDSSSGDVFTGETPAFGFGQVNKWTATGLPGTPASFAGKVARSFAGVATDPGNGNVYALGQNYPAIGSGDLSNASPTVSNLVTESGAFEVGQTIVGNGIPSSTTIEACSPSCASPTELTLSAAATATGAGVELRIVPTAGTINVFHPDGTSAGIPPFSVSVGAKPVGIDVDSAGHVYVPDASTGTVHEYDTSGALLQTFDPSVGGHGTLNDPSDVAVDSSGDIYVSDRSTNHVSEIQKIDTHGGTGGTFKLSFDGATTGATFTGDLHAAAGTGDVKVAKGTGDLSLLGTGTGSLTKGSDTVTAFGTSTGTFTVGESISGEGIRLGTTIAAVGGGTLTMSKPARIDVNAAALASGSRVITNVSISEGSFEVGMTISEDTFFGGNIPNDLGFANEPAFATTISAVGANSITLSTGVTAAATGTALRASSLTNVNTTEGAFDDVERLKAEPYLFGIYSLPIISVGPGTITTVSVAQTSATGVSLTAGSDTITNIHFTEGQLAKGLAVSGPGIASESFQNIIQKFDLDAGTVSFQPNVERPVITEPGSQVTIHADIAIVESNVGGPFNGLQSLPTIGNAKRFDAGLQSAESAEARNVEFTDTQSKERTARFVNALDGRDLSLMTCDGSDLEAHAEGVGDVTGGSPTVENLVTSSGSFRVGQLISGSGIPAGTSITAVAPGEPGVAPELTLSANATTTATEVALSVTHSHTCDVTTVVDGSSTPGRVLKFASNGAFLEDFVPPSGTYTADALAVDRSTGEVFVAGGNSDWAPIGGQLTPSGPDFSLKRYSSAGAELGQLGFPTLTASTFTPDASSVDPVGPAFGIDVDSSNHRVYAMGLTGNGSGVLPDGIGRSTVHVFAPASTLSVDPGGTGGGTVDADSGAIEDCAAGGGTCSDDYANGTTVTLSAVPDGLSVLSGWSVDGQPGACSGTGDCSVTINADTTVHAIFDHQLALTVLTSGAGAGSVTSNPAGIDCGQECGPVPFVEGSDVVLTATPQSGSTFVGWSGGGCSGTGTCTVTMDADATVTATFHTPQSLTVIPEGTGTGTVTSSPAGIDCGSACGPVLFPEASSVELTATPDLHQTFAGWSGGGCSGTGTCAVTMDAATTVHATFTQNQQNLTIAKEGTGNGVVSSNPAGINCGPACGPLAFDEGESVVLTASPAAHTTFAGWSVTGQPSACPGTGTCTVTMNAATTVHATFNLTSHELKVTPLGNGAGTVAADSGAISGCSSAGGVCADSYLEGESITLSATPGAHSEISGWSGCDANPSAGECEVAIDADTEVTATFTLRTHALTVSKSGSGGGSVTCDGGACAASYPEGSSVTLAAGPDPGSSFVGWSGGGCSGTGACTVTINADTSVSAGFDKLPTPRTCTVPKLAGKSLSQARSALTAAGCTLGKVTKPKKRKGHKLGPLIVKSSSPAAGASLPAGGAVNVKLGPKPRKHRR